MGKNETGTISISWRGLFTFRLSPPDKKARTERAFLLAVYKWKNAPAFCTSGGLRTAGARREPACGRRVRLAEELTRERETRRSNPSLSAISKVGRTFWLRPASSLSIIEIISTARKRVVHQHDFKSPGLHPLSDQILGPIDQPRSVGSRFRN